MVDLAFKTVDFMLQEAILSRDPSYAHEHVREDNALFGGHGYGIKPIYDRR